MSNKGRMQEGYQSIEEQNGCMCMLVKVYMQ